MSTEINRRVLVIDDNRAIHEDFRKILTRSEADSAQLDEMMTEFFDDDATTDECTHFQLDSAYQGEEGLRLIEAAQNDGVPYAMAFVDMRMPPGWDGLETITRIWKKFPELQVVICTAYSDHSWDDLQDTLGETDQLVILKKPFDTIEARQLAIALTKKWHLTQQAKVKMDDLNRMVEVRTRELVIARDELVDTNESLESARQDAESANRSKSEFLANMSHEIRTPMTAILGFAEMLREQGDESDVESPADFENSSEGKHCEPSQERKIAVNTIIRNSHHLLQVINDILDLSKIEAGKLDVDLISCSPCQIVSDVMALMHVRASEKGLHLSNEFTTAIPETFTSDPMRIRQILINLIGNAIKFTQEGSVRLSIGLSQGEDDVLRLEFQVQDTGVGMSEEELERVFRPFEQANCKTTRDFGGTGLGLSISSRLAEMLGGNLTATSVQDEGSCFRVTVETGDCESVEMIGLGQATDRSCNSKKNATPSKNNFDLGCKILLVEDGPDNQRLISLILRKSGAEVDLAENGQLGVDRVLAARANGDDYDIILMDMQMPIMDGYTATQKLREAGVTAPVIALTAHAMKGDRAKCLKVGCTDYSTKPINRQEFLTLIEKHWNQVKESRVSPSGA